MVCIYGSSFSVQGLEDNRQAIKTNYIFLLPLRRLRYKPIKTSAPPQNVKTALLSKVCPQIRLYTGLSIRFTKVWQVAVAHITNRASREASSTVWEPLG
jgi:hypothetical protein